MELCAVAYGWPPSETGAMALAELEAWAKRGERWIRNRAQNPWR